MKQSMEFKTVHIEQLGRREQELVRVYSGITSTGQRLYVLEDVFESNLETFLGEIKDPDEWLPSVDEENCWIAATCEACGTEFRPIDGYHEPGEHSYCATCCHW